jgi:hypothetical protein
MEASWPWMIKVLKRDEKKQKIPGVNSRDFCVLMVIPLGE